MLNGTVILTKRFLDGSIDFTHQLWYDYDQEDPKAHEKDGYYIKDLKWEFSYADPLKTDDLSHIVEHCNNPPQMFCFLNEYYILEPERYFANLTYYINDPVRGMIVEMKRSFTYIINAHTDFYPNLSERKKFYQLGEDITFDAS